MAQVKQERREREQAPERESGDGEEVAEQIPQTLPLLPVRDAVYFPHMIFPLVVGRERSIRALDDAMEHGRYLLLSAQKQVGIDEPTPDDIYRIGVAAEIMQILKVPDGTVRVMLEGLVRVKILDYLSTDPLMRVKAETIPVREEKGIEIEAMMRQVSSQFEQIVNMGRTIPPEALFNVMNIDEPGKLADSITPYLAIKVEAKQEILETIPPRERLEKLSLILNRETEILEIQRNIRSKVEKEMGETQREFILREQMRAIQQELGERDERGLEIEEYREKIAAAQMPEDVAEKAQKELDRLEKMPFAAPEGTVVRTYLDWLVSLPWSVSTDDNLDIDSAEKVLDEDHYGLTKVKERVLEFLAVRKLSGSMKGPILCFVGPPGTGKTSIGKSIARAMGRKFFRMSLGGIRDEAEIRGHRRTYIGALPGRVIQGIKTTGSKNPVFMLDEIDKLGIDFRGDPSSALLEALDPEQNDQFSDHYLEVPFSLSDVMFITTANILDPVPPALKDRMEVIEFPGYTEQEKVAIAEQFLVPKQTKEHGLDKDGFLTIETDALKRVIREYTREAGVRNLERTIATLCRKVAKKVAAGDGGKKTVIAAGGIPDYLGAPKFRHGLAEEQDEVGAATCLFYTEVGGDVSTVEVSLIPGREGRLILTGQLGEVMRESAQAALTYVRSRSSALGVDPEIYQKNDIHIHVPAGAVPKDGPSAGITIAAALASAVTKRPIKRTVAMTGEITLRGRVLPIGGLKEKALAAHRAGIRTIVMPDENERDLEDIPANVKKRLSFKFVQHMDQVLDIALRKAPRKPEPDAAKEKPGRTQAKAGPKS
jgi:ATP-dependent Lon protease